MVAYSFRPRFVAPILAGTKTQTIRAPRKRHARPGETLQLYTGMRTKRCELIREAKCVSAQNILLWLFEDGEHDGFAVAGHPPACPDLDVFARADGFADWADLKAFWRAEHPGVYEFHGVLIRWEA